MKLQKLNIFVYIWQRKRVGSFPTVGNVFFVLPLLKVVVCLPLMEIPAQLISRKILTMNYLLL